MAIGTYRFRASLVCAIVTFSLTFQSLYAAGSGSIKGHVFDKVTSEPLDGANVVVLNTGLGAAADNGGLITIYGVPAGQQTLKISYVGYQTITVQVTVPENGVLEQEFRLSPQTIEGQEVVVTAQASGQNAAINQQLTSDKIANIVSSARIKALPDANAAESIGRLPGVSVVRNGGQATQVVIRGLEPKYNSITIAGIALPATNSNDRGTDLSMISSSSLEGIEVYKTVTADMDAAVIGGVVNFDVRCAKPSSEDVPLVSFNAQGGYKGMMDSYGDYKFVASVEKRFLNDKFGVFVQGIAQRQNLTSDKLSAYYDNQPLAIDVARFPDSIAMGSTTLSFVPTIQKRYDGTATLDYKLPDGDISLLNIISHGTTTTEEHSERYGIKDPGTKDIIYFGTSLQSTDLNVITNILSYKQTFGSLKIDAKLSNAYSDNVTPNGWSMDFQQQSAGTHNIPANLTPSEVAQLGWNLLDTSKMKWTGNKAWSSFTKQNDQQISLNIENNFNLSDIVSIAVKGGGMYKYTTRYYNHDESSGDLSISSATAQIGARQYIIQQLPWLQDAPYYLDPSGNSAFRFSGFYDSGLNTGSFLNGEYTMHSLTKTNVIDKIMGILQSYRSTTTSSPDQPVFDPDFVQSLANDYSGNETRSACYLMATLKVGPWLTVIPGVRYQVLRTSYTAPQFLGFVITNLSQKKPYSMVTAENSYGYWLPDFHIKINPSEEISLRVSYTNTIAYPDFQSFIPKETIDNSNYIITYNNTALKPERAQNYDVQVSVHDNSIGLFAVSPFLKLIDDEIYNPGKKILDTNGIKTFGPSASLTNPYVLYSYINNPNQVKVWGIETEWQTNFWYLPSPFKSLVMNVNYTHIFSQGTFTNRLLLPVPGSRSRKYILDTLYNDRLYQQPNDVVNLSFGYDYGKFSILFSMIYQSEVFNQPSFWWTLRSDKTKYLRWDVVIKQGLPWYNMQIYCNVNNLNNESDIYTIRKNGFPLLENSYGLTADVGIQWSF
jgi:TonB-dependent receptor